MSVALDRSAKSIVDDIVKSVEESAKRKKPRFVHSVRAHWSRSKGEYVDDETALCGARPKGEWVEGSAAGYIICPKCYELNPECFKGLL